MIVCQSSYKLFNLLLSRLPTEITMEEQIRWMEHENKKAAQEQKEQKKALAYFKKKQTNSKTLLKAKGKKIK